MLTAIAILTVAVYAALTVMALRDKRTLRNIENTEFRKSAGRRRRAAVRSALGESAVRRHAASREDRMELIPDIRRRSPDEVRQMVRWTIDSHRPPFRNN